MSNVLLQQLANIKHGLK